MRILSTLTLLLLLSFPILSQEQIGLRLDNYSGVNGLIINPTQSVTSPFKWDLNIVSGGFNAQSNYGYFRESSLLDLWQNGDNIIAERDLESGSIPPANSIVAVANNDDGEKYFSTFGIGTGPSLMLNLESGHSFGFFTNARFGYSIHDIPAAVSFDRFYDTPFFDFVDVEPFSMAGIAWAELGLNYAYKFPTYDGYMALGINVKFIQGYEAAFLQASAVNPTAQIPGDTLIFESLNADYGLTTSNLSLVDFPGDASASPTINGGGFGIDLGYTYIYEGNEDNYKWKLGASLLDLGSINFDKNTEVHDLRNDTLQFLDQNVYKEGLIEDRIRLLSFETFGDSTASLEIRNFRVALPSALSFQFDYMLIENIYVNTLLIQRIALGGSAALRRNNLLAVSGRYEHRWFGGGVSISALNYKQVAVGLSGRLAFLTFGTEDVGSLFGRKKFDSTDFYLGFKINPFDLGLNLGGRGRGKNVKCYEF